MADQEEQIQNVLSCSGRQVFIGDLERRRPTKRMTTMRSFAVVRNWLNQQNGEQSKNVGSSASIIQSDQVSSRTDSKDPKRQSSEVLHEQLEVHEVQPVSDVENEALQFPADTDSHDAVLDLPLPGSNKKGDGAMSTGPSVDTSHPNLNKPSVHEVATEISSEITPDGTEGFDDVHPMAIDDSPVKDKSPKHASVENTVPGGEASVSNMNDRSQKKSTFDIGGDESVSDDGDDDDDDNDDPADIFEKKTPAIKDKSPSRSFGLQSGVASKRPRSAARKRVAFDTKTKENKKPNFDDEEYEAQNFVRLFNADRGRNGSATDVTDLDIVLTNVEEISLQIKSKADSSLKKRLIREAFIQMRQIFSDTIDIYKEKKFLQSATAKVNSEIKKKRQKLMDIQEKRKESEKKLNKLKSECSKIEKRIKSNEEANSFLKEFEEFQEHLRKNDTVQSNEEYRGDVCLTSLLCEASGYLSTGRQLRSINDSLQSWLDKNIT